MKTTPKYQIVPATDAHAVTLASRMRLEDRTEVLASSGYSPSQALHTSLAGSLEAWTCLADGEVVCMFGVGKTNMLG
ncbi:MAG: hypothetical protein ACREIQ_08010, partial [Nitrospiria bacterium]